MNDVFKQLEELEERRRELLKRLPKKKATARHKAKLTTERVRRFRYDVRGPKIQRLWDEEVNGFGVEVFPSGKKSFVLRYRIHGKQRLMTIGDAKLIPLAQARKEATEALLKVREGRDPLMERDLDLGADTLSEVFEAYVKRAEYTRKSANYRRSIESNFRNHISQTLGHVPVTQITGRQVAAVIDSIMDRGTAGAARAALSALQAVLKFAKSRRLVEVNQALDLGIEFDLKKRERTLTDDEIRALWFADDGPAGGAIRWMLSHGNRVSECLALQWSHIEGDVLSVPSTITKSSRAYKVPITKLARHILAEQIAGQSRFSRYVFSSGVRPISADVVRRRVRELGFKGVSPHTVRHHFASKVSEQSGREITARLMNHSIPGQTEAYTHSHFLDSKREALTLWHAHLVEVLGLDISTGFESGTG